MRFGPRPGGHSDPALLEGLGIELLQFRVLRAFGERIREEEVGMLDKPQDGKRIVGSSYAIENFLRLVSRLPRRGPQFFRVFPKLTDLTRSYTSA